MIDNECTFISDRDKGLIEAEAVFGPDMVKAWCCVHLKTNFTEKFGRALGLYFWAIARARTEAAYDAAMKKLREIKPAAAEYLEETNPSRWAAAHFPGGRYGLDTSNIAESMNHVLHKDRELAIVPLLDTIWTMVMVSRHGRLQAARNLIEKGVTETPFLAGKIEEQHSYSRPNTAFPSSASICRVQQQGRNGVVHVVNTALSTCTCGRYQENGIPCGHAITAISKRRGQQRRLDPYLPDGLKAETWAAIYATPLLVLGEDRCQAPKTRVPRGRPR